MLQSFTFLQLDDLIALLSFLYTPGDEPSNSCSRQAQCASPCPRNPILSIRVHRFVKGIYIFRQTPSASPLPRSASPSRLASVLIRRRETRSPRACLSVFRSPLPSTPVCLSLVAKSWPCSPRVSSSLWKTLIVVSDCKVRRTTAATDTGECARAIRTGRSSPAARWSS